ncbi:Prostaglandin E2 receptor EP4 subtype [Holothuria leucospilota]|uniref:Prostaglandin E2 receptor EP4 subtype n=1 Tax=Holothuria leucospilota TaxID=206669 RepID=A0A9Q1HC17_HOLLE|nr:Prostaglandin E2 receptor EP4 subtype [Holothuria leucospilota]
MSSSPLTPVPPRTPVTENCPVIPNSQDIEVAPINFKNVTLITAVQPSVKVITPIIMLTIGLCSNIVAAGIFNCSRTTHRQHAFYGILRGMLYTNILGYLEIYPVIILGHINGLHWIGGQSLCNFHGIAILNFGLCLAYLSGALAWERFLATCRPHTYDKKIEKRKIPYIIGLMWVVATFTSLLPLAGFGRFTQQYPQTWCFLDWRYEETVGRLFCSILATAVSAIGLFIIISLVASTSVCVYRTFQERKNKLPAARFRANLEGYVGNSTPHTSRTNGPLIRLQDVESVDGEIPYGNFRSLLCWATFQYVLISGGFFFCYIPVVVSLYVLYTISISF